MKILVASLITALAAPAAAGPDFTTPSPKGHALAASEGQAPILPEDDVTFSHDSARLTEAGIAQIARAARWMRTQPQVQLVLEGYADHLGTSGYNEDLARRRANTVRAELVKLGVPRDRIVVVVYGEELADPAGSPLDRRVVMFATPLRRVVATR